MKPYYEKNGQTIFHGDCLKIMKQFSDKSFDLCLTDPPYGISQKSGGFRGKELDFGKWDKFTKKQLKNLLRQIIRVIRGTIFMFCSAEQLSFLLTELKKKDFLTRQLIWYKPTAFSMNADKMYMWATENIIWAKKRKAKFNPRLKRNLFVCNSESNQRWHKTQKPIKLIKEFILDATDENDTILDPFMGSGTTLVAARQLGRKAVGIEINQKYCEIAKQRLRQETLNLKS